jgi:hypothetical protein
MSNKSVQIKMAGPESIVICEEERFDLIAQVARALQERRQEQYENAGVYDSDPEDAVFDFTELGFDVN